MTYYSFEKQNNAYPTDQHGWAEFLPERNASRAGRIVGNNNRVPWVVVGAGFTGLACARRLAYLHPDDEIIVLEARLVGQGASGRNSGYAVATSHFGGGFRAEMKAEYTRVNRINQAGLDLLRTQVREHAIDCQWHEGGFYHVAADHRALREYDRFLQYLKFLEIDHRAFEREELKARLGTRLYKKGIHVPGGALVQPAALVCGLADSMPANVRLYENSPVLRISRGTPITLQLENSEIITDKLILAKHPGKTAR